MAMKVDMSLKMKVGDDVEWFNGKYSCIKNYGTIVKICPKTAIVRDEYGNEARMKLTQLNWS
jgi:hypothetical protein